MNTYPDNFLKALAFALKWEVGDFKNGGYTNDPQDPGGETKWGISKRSYPSLDIQNLTLDAAREIYFADYWQTDRTRETNQLSFCDQMPWPMNLVHFDCTVNIGNRKTAKDGTAVLHRRANMILQRALGVDDDGYLGPVSYRAIADADPLRLALKALTQRDFYYSTLGGWSLKYVRGWLKRTNDLRATVMRNTPPNVAAGAAQ